MKTAIVYHANCVDGFGAAWAASKFFDNAIYHPLVHGASLPEKVLECDILYFLDISLKRDEIIKLRESGKQVFVIDHHDSAQREIDGLDGCVFDMNHSGAALTWIVLNKQSEKPLSLKYMPLILFYIEDGDLYRFKMPESKHILNVLHAVEKTFENYDHFNNQISVRDGFAKIANKGKNIFEFNQNYLDFVKKFVQKINFAGFDEVPVINTHSFQVSDLLHDLAMESKHGFAVSWFQLDNGNFKYSLRSKSEDAMNVALLAEKLYKENNLISGAGHPCAAGIISKTLFHLQGTK